MPEGNIRILFVAFTNLEIWVSAFSAILAAIIGFCAIAWQIRRQARTAMKQRAYEHIVLICEKASDATVEFSNFIRIFLVELESYCSSESKEGDIYRINSRVPRMLELQSRQGDAVVSVIRLIERYLIIDPRIEIFKIAFNVSFHEIYKIYFEKFYPITYGKMPTEFLHPDKGSIIHPPETCTDTQLKEIKKIGFQLISKMDYFQG